MKRSRSCAEVDIESGHAALGPCTMTVVGGNLSGMRVGLVATGLFASAFSPVLVALVLVSTPFDTWWADATLVMACAVPAVLVSLALRSAKRVQTTRLRFARVRRTDRDVLTFMASFVLPIATAFFAVDAAKWAATGVLLGLLMVIYIRGQMFHLNPVLAAFGYRSFEVENVDGVIVTVLSRRRSLPPGGTVLAVRFSEEMYIDFERDGS